MADQRSSACSSTSTDLSSVNAVGEPRLTSNDAWMEAGTRRSEMPSRNNVSCFGSPGGSAQPRELDTYTWIAAETAASAYARPALAKPPDVDVCEPIGEVRSTGSRPPSPAGPA